MSEQSGVPISDGKFAVFHYSMHDVEGEVLETTRGDSPVGYVHGRNELLIPALEEALSGRAPGETFELSLDPNEAYGPRDPEGYVEMSRDAFPPDLEIIIGMPFSAEDDQGNDIPVWVAELNDDSIVVTTNHPLAGASVIFQVEVLEVRDPDPEELVRFDDQPEG